MLWESLGMQQWLRNAPATFTRCETNLFETIRIFEPNHLDDIFVDSRTMSGKSQTKVHHTHVRNVLTLMRKHKLHANLKKRVFAASWIPLLWFFGASCVNTVYSLIRKGQGDYWLACASWCERISWVFFAQRRTCTSTHAIKPKWPYIIFLC